MHDNPSDFHTIDKWRQMSWQLMGQEFYSPPEHNLYKTYQSRADPLSSRINFAFYLHIH